MTPEGAIDRLRKLDVEAEAGWPGGYDAERVRQEAGAAVAVLAISVAAAPAEYQAMLARGYVKALAER